MKKIAQFKVFQNTNVINQKLGDMERQLSRHQN